MPVLISLESLGIQDRGHSFDFSERNHIFAVFFFL